MWACIHIRWALYETRIHNNEFSSTCKQFISGIYHYIFTQSLVHIRNPMHGRRSILSSQRSHQTLESGVVVQSNLRVDVVSAVVVVTGINVKFQLPVRTLLVRYSVLT